MTGTAGDGGTLGRRRLLRPAWPLVACAIVALLWPASEVWAGWAYGTATGHRLAVEVGPGWFGLTFGPDNGTRSGHNPGHAFYVHRLTDADRAALAFPRIYPGPGDHRFYAPLWVVTLCDGLFAAGLLASRARRRRADQPGRCPRCGYDLRATPDRCPECGAAAAVP